MNLMPLSCARESGSNGKFCVFYLTTSFKKLHTLLNQILFSPPAPSGDCHGGLMVARVFPDRYRPAQKTDSLGESGSHGSLHSTPEQAMAAQSQHHQQYIGEPPPAPTSTPTLAQGLLGRLQGLSAPLGWVSAPAASKGLLQTVFFPTTFSSSSRPSLWNC